MRHGLPDTEREWTLKGRKKKTRKNNNDEPDVNIKTCPDCYAVHESKLKQCPICNHVYVVKKTQIEITDGELVELDKTQIILQRKTEVKNARDYDSLVALGRSRQYKYPEQWAAKQIEIRGQYAKRRN
jgi:DNA repair protein RadD